MFIHVLINFIFRARFGFTVKLRGKHRDFSNTCSPIHAQPSPLSTSPQEGTFVLVNELALAHCYHSKSIIYFGVVHSMSLKKFIMTCIHCYNITLLLPYKSCVLHIHPSLPQPLATNHLFTVSIVLSFLGCHVVGILH